MHPYRLIEQGIYHPIILATTTCNDLHHGLKCYGSSLWTASSIVGCSLTTAKSVTSYGSPCTVYDRRVTLVSIYRWDHHPFILHFALIIVDSAHWSKGVLWTLYWTGRDAVNVSAIISKSIAVLNRFNLLCLTELLPIRIVTKWLIVFYPDVTFSMWYWDFYSYCRPFVTALFTLLSSGCHGRF